METLLWILVCFGAGLVIVGIVAIVVGIAVTAAPATRSQNEAAPEQNVWVMIAEKMLSWFDRLIGLLLSDDTPKSKRLMALGLMLIILGGLCLAGGVYGISVTGAVSAGKASCLLAAFSVEIA